MRKTLRAYLNRALLRAAAPLETTALSQPALVLAPHQDDETLGCGGTILHKRQLGAQVRIAFMTDGSLAQSHLNSGMDLVQIRRQEALQAAAVLGVADEDVEFLGHRDGALAAAAAQASEAVQRLITQQQPGQLFLPHRRDANADHQATYRIGRAALKAAEHTVEVFEYPVWFWYHWPWVNVSLEERRGIRKILKNSIRYQFGLQALRWFNRRVSIEDLWESKRTALNEHRSQMTRLIPTPGWLTLGDIAQGQFLEQFFLPHEFFTHSTYHPDQESDRQKIGPQDRPAGRKRAGVPGPHGGGVPPPGTS